MDSAVNSTDPALSPVNHSLKSEDKIRLLRDMIRVRHFEFETLRQYQSGKMGGFLHLYIGQESVAVGACSLMGDNDHVITAYRCHGHALAVGMSMNECMAELFGKATGCSKGKGGSMHFFAPDKHYWGGHGIVGGQTPLGAGMAYALKYKHIPGCCLCYLGDGAINQGAFHESLNIAALFQLPVVYIIENNGYSMGTSQKRSSAYKSSLAERAEAYNMAWDVFVGEDLYEVRNRTNIAIERARKAQEPTLLEIQTYRYFGRSVGDANAKKYRTSEEIEAYKHNHDPLQIFGKTLLEEDVVTDADIQEIDKAAKDEANAAVAFAEESPVPQESDILTDIYWEVDHQTDAAKNGSYFFNT